MLPDHCLAFTHLLFELMNVLQGGRTSLLSPGPAYRPRSPSLWGAYNRLGCGFNRHFRLADLHPPILLRKSTRHPLSIRLKGDFFRENSNNDTPQGRIHARSWTSTLPHHRPVIYREHDRESLINSPKIDLNSAENIFPKRALRKRNSVKAV